MKIGKIILALIMITSQVGCSQKLTLDLINNPSKKYFARELKEQLEPYKDFPDMVKSTNERENTYFNIRIESRDKALKEINFESKKTIIIIDKLRTNYSGLVEESFIFTDNDDNYSNIIQSSDEDTIRIIKKKSLKSDKLDEDVLKLYQKFNSNNIDLTTSFKGQIDTMGFFYVTVVKDGKVKYYIINTKTDYKAVEIY